MFLQHVEVAVVDGHEPEFERALCEVRQRVFMSPGVRGFKVAQDVEDRLATQGRVITDVTWMAD